MTKVLNETKYVVKYRKELKEAMHVVYMYYAIWTIVIGDADRTIFLQSYISVHEMRANKVYELYGFCSLK